MQKISSLTTLQPERSREPLRSERRKGKFIEATMTALSTSVPEIGQAHIDSLWVRMAGIFGPKWTASYGVEPSDTWLAGLIDMTEEEVLNGLVSCLNWPKEWPPTLPEFRSLCRPRRDPAHQVFRALPEPPESRERRKAAGKAQLAALREEVAYRNWLGAHQDRATGPLEDVLHVMRAMIRAGGAV